jgi:hypothetical protein
LLKRYTTPAIFRHKNSSQRIAICSPTAGTVVNNPEQEVATMSIAERISSSKGPFRIPASSENVLLAIVAFAFLSLHVAAGTLLHAALPD